MKACTMTASVPLNIINPEAIEAFIRGLGNYLPEDNVPEYEGWAMAALKPVICSCPGLFQPASELPDDAPDWLTPEKLAQGPFHRFAPSDGDACFRDLARIAWLSLWLNVAFMGHVHLRARALPPSWFRGLRHIRNLEDAVVRARRDLKAWAKDGPDRPFSRWCDVRGLVASGAMEVRAVRPDSGFIWYELMTPLALQAEATRMAHCLYRSSYSAELQAGTARFFSFRKPDGTAHLTLRVPEDGPWEAYRRRNLPARADDLEAARALLAEITASSAPRAHTAPAAPHDEGQWDRARAFTSLVWDLQARDEELTRREYQSEDKIQRFIEEWLAGPGDDLEELLVQLREELGAPPMDDLDGEEEGDPDIDSKAYHLVEEAITDMGPTWLNFQRVRRWCWSYTSYDGYNALFTTFRDMLSDDEYEDFRREALKCWDADVVRNWFPDEEPDLARLDHENA